MKINFKIDNEIKQEYLNSKPTGTAESDAFVLREFDDYEALVSKQVYNLSIPELNEMLASLRNTSKRVVQKNKSILTNYIDFCVGKKLVPHMENRAKYIDVENFVAKQALINKFVSKEKLREYQKLIYNEQDQLLLWLLFIGVRGRTVEDGTMEEVINLTIDDVNEKENTLILRQNDGKFRILDGVDNFIIKLIKDTYEQEFYTENNGEITKNPRIPDPRQIKINREGEFSRYIFRIPGKDKYENFSASLLNSRMRKIQEICDNKYLTWTSIYMSGMLQMALDIYQEKGEVTDRDFDNICIRHNYGIKESANSLDKKSNYWFNLKDLFNQYEGILY